MLVENGNVGVTDTDRKREGRAQRYDWAALLFSRGSITESAFSSIRRFEEDLAAQFRVEGGRSDVVVDGSRGHVEGVTARSLDAGRRVRALYAALGARARELQGLCAPSVVEGKPVNNWRAVMARFGWIGHKAQAKAIVGLCGLVDAAYGDMDRQPRKAA
jgi:hypothetical protein